MASSRFSIEAVVSMIDRVSNPMGKASSAVGSFSAKTQAHFAKAEKSSLGFGGVIKGILGANLIQSAFYAMKNMGDSAINLASDLTEVQNVVDTTFGGGADAINRWSQTAITQFGLSELQAKKFNGTMGAMLKSSGLSEDKLVTMSTTLSGLAGDFASFYNLDSQAAFDKIRSGISGETEPLKQLGINMSVANLEAYALANGITKQWKSMNQAEQVQLRYNYLLKASKDAQGDFAKTLMTSYANQKRVFSTNFDQVLARIATQILPMLTSGLISFNKWLNTVDAKSLGNSIKAAFSVIVPVLKIVIQGISLLINFVISVIGVMWNFRYAILFVAIALGAYYLVTQAIMALQFVKGILLTIQTFQMALPLIYSMTGATNLWELAQWKLNASMLANPIGLISIAIAGLVIWVIYLVNHLEEMNRKFLELTGILDKPVIKMLLSSLMGGSMVSFMSGVRENVKGQAVDNTQLIEQQRAGGLASPISNQIANGTSNSTVNGNVTINVNSSDKNTTVTEKGLPSWMGTVLNQGLQP